MMPSGRKWVVLVDDDIDACDLLGAILQKRGVRARCLYSAADAIELLDELATTPECLPALVITDLLMPGIDVTVRSTILPRGSEFGDRPRPAWHTEGSGPSTRRAAS